MSHDSHVRIFISDDEFFAARDAVAVPTHQTFRAFIQIEVGKHGYVVEDWKAIRYLMGKFTVVKGQPKLKGRLVIGPTGAFKRL